MHGSRAMQSESLSGQQRKRLRALAHHLDPIVRVGHSGIGPGLIAALERALRDHELVKVRLYEPEDKKALAKALAAQTGADLCGLIGHTAILYRRHPEKPVISID
jgi:RNA-binding protein